MRSWIKCVVAAGRHGFVRKERDGGSGGEEGEIDSADKRVKVQRALSQAKQQPNAFLRLHAGGGTRPITLPCHETQDGKRQRK